MKTDPLARFFRQLLSGEPRVVFLGRRCGKSTMVRALRERLKAFPECKECQCYLECRIDCPDHKACMERLPEYK